METFEKFQEDESMAKEDESQEVSQPDPKKPQAPPKPRDATAKDKELKGGEASGDEPRISLPVPAVNVTSGSEALLDGGTHVGIAVRVRSSGGPSVLMVPDFEGVKAGTSPVYITRPISLELDKLRKVLEKKGVTLPEPLDKLLKDTRVACNAFYYTANNGPLLMMFTLQFNKGLFTSLFGDDDQDIVELFDIEGVALRVFRCGADKFSVLQKYAAELSA
jgi:hypothetical protein